MVGRSVFFTKLLADCWLIPQGNSAFICVIICVNLRQLFKQHASTIISLIFAGHKLLTILTIEVLSSDVELKLISIPSFLSSSLRYVNNCL